MSNWVMEVYKNKNKDGSLNLCGKKIAALRKGRQEKTSQNKLASMLQLEGIDLDKNAVQRIESGQRFVTDLELKAFAKVLHTTADDLLED
jgi:transcriptional regulator with XRE-family HTH domain